MAGKVLAFPAIDLQTLERPKPMKLVRRTALGAALGLMLCGVAWAAGPAPVAVVMTTDAGVVELELYPAKAPVTTANFLRYVDEGRYAGGQFYEAEARYLVATEWAQTAEDILYRRTKHYLHLTPAERAAFADWFRTASAAAA